jgi:putative hydrolase of the HAD superfamily
MTQDGTIQAVLFDLDGTLRHNHPNGFDTLLEFLGDLGYPVTTEQRRAGLRWTHYYWSISTELPEDLREFGGEGRAFWARHTARQLGALGVEGDLPALAATLSQMFDERYNPGHHVPDDVVPTLRRLAELGYTVGLVSNRTETLETLVGELGLAGCFVFTLSAGQAECWKPDPRIFLKGAELAGAAPEATVYVGDNFYADVEGARAAGLQPVLIDPHGVFPDAGCPVIHSLGELEGVLARLARDGRPGTKPAASASVR